ncbi:MAG: elongation factor G [Elusimicrobiota bacterium]
MKVYETRDIRNVVICGASGAGKTQLVESMLFGLGIINRLGKVEEGNTVSDYDPIEKERMSSISSSLITLEYSNIKFNFIDTPGFADFFGNVAGALEVCEVVLLVINPHEGVGVTTKKIWRRAKALGKAVIIYINHMDHSGSTFDEIVSQLKKYLSPNIAPVIAPMGQGENFKGIIKLLESVAVEDGKEAEIPGELKEAMAGFSESLMDSVATTDDSLMEKFLEEGSLNSEEIRQGLTKGLLKGEIVPVLCGSAVKGIGVEELIDFLGKYAPAPDCIEQTDRPIVASGYFKAIIFKAESQMHVGQVNFLKVCEGSLKAGEQVYNIKNKKKMRVNQLALKRGDENIVVSEVKSGDICALVKLEDVRVNDTVSAKADSAPLKPIEFPQPIVDRGVYPKNKGEEEKVAQAFSNIIDEDPTLSFGFNPETKEMVLRGIGTLQLELVIKKIKNRYEAEVELRAPRISFKETVGKKVDNIRGKYKKQTGGRGQYGDCVIRMEPIERGSGFEFKNEIVGGKIPSNYIPSIEKGIVNAMEKGVIAGFPVVDIRIALFDGSYHDVDSSDMAFQVAGSLAFQNAMKEAQPYILEPIMKARIRVSNDYTGAIMGDLNSRRGKVLGIEPAGEEQIVVSQIPKISLSTYAEDLRSLTSGEGEYTVEFDHFEAAPMDIQQHLVEKYQKEREEGR